MNKIIALKVSGDFALREDIGTLKLVKDISYTILNGYKVLLVVGGGAGNRGSQMDKSIPGYERDMIGMEATLKNTEYFLKLLNENGIDKDNMEILSPLDNNYKNPLPRNFAKVFSEKSIALVGGGSGFTGFTTDSAVALMAGNAGATKVIKKFTDVCGIYDKNPNTNSDATLLHCLSYEDSIERKVGGLDDSCIALCKERGIDLLIGGPDQSIIEILNGGYGTIITSEDNIAELQEQHYHDNVNVLVKSFKNSL